MAKNYHNRSSDLREIIELCMYKRIYKEETCKKVIHICKEQILLDLFYLIITIQHLMLNTLIYNMRITGTNKIFS